jgi:hypothetical protein
LIEVKNMNAASPFDMLRKLAAGVGPGSGVKAVAPASPAGSQPELGKLDFGQLLEKARSGELATSLPVTIDPGVAAQLSPDQLARLAKAADRAEAEGFAMAMVQLDGQNLLLDVQGRRITGILDATAAAATAIDGVVVAPPAQKADDQPALAAETSIPRESLLKLLDRPSLRPGTAA